MLLYQETASPIRPATINGTNHRSPFGRGSALSDVEGTHRSAIWVCSSHAVVYSYLLV